MRNVQCNENSGTSATQGTKIFKEGPTMIFFS